MKFLARRWTEAVAPAAAAHTRVYAVTPGVPFLDALAEGLLHGNLPVPGGPRPDPLQLADTTLYLPSRRATRALQEAFLRISGASALLLPRIKPISEGSEELDLIATVEDLAADGTGQPSRVISELERQLTLTSLVLRWAHAEARATGPGAELQPFAPTGARTPAQAAKMARALARLIDELEIEGIDAARLNDLVPEEFSEHWSDTLSFLQIVTQFWPEHLAERKLVSAVGRRKRLLAAAAAQLASVPARAPVIVAGVTKTDPAAVALIRSVMDLPNGAVVLPSIDRALEDESWAAIDHHPEHPQFGLKKLIDALSLNRADIQTLGSADRTPQRARWSLVCEAMRPAATTDRWHHFTTAANKKDMARALTGLSLVEAATAEEEAEAIALMLREAVETRGQTARLITPDRTIARRVAARLKVWEIDAEDGAGLPFAKTLPGALLDLTVAALESQFEPVALMALLKHPLCRAGMSPGEFRSGIGALELGAFRAPYFGSGLDGVEAALESAQKRSWSPMAVRRLKPADWQNAREVLQRLTRIFKPIAKAFASSKPTTLHRLAELHFEAAQSLARTGANDDGSALRQGEAGEWATKFFASLIDAATPAPEIVAVDYPDFYRTLVADKHIRRLPAHPRISICDPFEGRLQYADLVILGGLNEGTWPQAADPGPWLNRSMRQALGMAAPEERVGTAAYDFASQIAAPRVVLTRAAKVDGAPTVPSRWILRLQALVDGLGLELNAEQPWLAWAQGRNAIDGSVRPVRAPEPRPPVARRPRELSVTAIETWIANPYAIFARRILRLEPLALLGDPPGPALRGQIVHDTLGRFAQAFPKHLPKDIAKELAIIAEDVLADYTGNPRVAAFWVPRLARFAAWFAETELARRAGVANTVSEVSGKMV